MGRNVTLKLDEALLKKCRHAAVEENKSLSEWTADQMAKAILDKEFHEASKSRALKYLDEGVNLGGAPIYRGELHER